MSPFWIIVFVMVIAEVVAVAVVWVAMTIRYLQ